jgi:hypothetical protein
VHVNPQVAEAAGDEDGDGVASLVLDRVGDQFAGQQDRDVRVDRDVPGGDGGPDVIAGLGHRVRFRGQLGAAGV